MKTWTPDTCPAPGCIIEEIYDVDGAILGGGVTVRKCSAHKGVPDEELYDVLLNKENRPKNIVHRILVGHEAIKDLGLEEPKTNPDGSSAGVDLKVGVEYAWEFIGGGKDRVLSFEVKGAALTEQQKSDIVSLCDTKFGAGKIVYSLTPLSPKVFDLNGK